MSVWFFPDEGILIPKARILIQILDLRVVFNQVLEREGESCFEYRFVAGVNAYELLLIVRTSPLFFIIYRLYPAVANSFLS